MEGKVVKAVFLIAVVLCMVASQTHAASTQSFKDCYSLCFIGCMIKPDRNVFKCALKCLKQCMFGSQSASVPEADTSLSCKFGCAASRCTNISTEADPGAEAVEGCVNSCSESCPKKH